MKRRRFRAVSERGIILRDGVRIGNIVTNLARAHKAIRTTVDLSVTLLGQFAEGGEFFFVGHREILRTLMSR